MNHARFRHEIPIVFLFLLSTMLTPSPTVAAPAAVDWRTPAEIADFRATPSYDETLAFVRRVEAAPGAQGAVKLDFYGDSAAGRPMPVVIVSKERAFTAQAARALNKPILLVINGIHGGEIDGKDATLMLLRDLAKGERPELLDAATILFLPIYNVDGHERVSPWNRPNQDGPVDGMGFRTTVDGHDLNRDFLKLETPEARNLVRLFNAWQPHLVVDNHVTNGVDHDWVITWAVPRAPQLAAPVDDWLQAAMPQILFDVVLAGHAQGPYVDLVDSLDPLKGFESLAGEPRYSTGYFPLRNRPVILVEMHSHKPYRERVLANRDFLAATAFWLGQGGLELRSAIASANLATTMHGGTGATAAPVALTYEKEAPDSYRIPLYAWSKRPSPVTGKEVLVFARGQVREEVVPWYQRLKVAKSLPRPTGYLVPAGWTEIERRLVDHGLRFERLAQGIEAEVETARLSNVRFAGKSYQGQTTVAGDVTRAIERRAFAAGTLWIPAAQPDFEVAVQLLEPEAPDSLFSWGFLSGLLEGKEYIDVAKLDELATAQLADPVVRAAWEKALADPAFAADGTARYLWWYRRTPYWDEQQELLPVFRRLTPLPRP